MRRKLSANQMVTLAKSKHTRPWSWTSVLHKCEKSNFYYLNHSDSLELLIVDVYRHLCLIFFGMFAYAFDIYSLQAWKTSKILGSRWLFSLPFNFIYLLFSFVCSYVLVSQHVHGRTRVLERPVSSLFQPSESQLPLGLGGKNLCGLSHVSICSLYVILNYNNKLSTGKSMNILKNKCWNHPYNLILPMEHL